MTGLLGKESGEISPTNSNETLPSASNGSTLMSNDVVKGILKHSVELAIEQLIDSGTVQELMSQAIGRVTAFESTLSGDYNSKVYNIDAAHRYRTRPFPYQRTEAVNDDDAYPISRFSRSRVCHRTSSLGVAFGCIWVRTSTLHLEADSEAPKGGFQTVTSFIFYPATWLKRIGVKHGMEASMVNSKDGWQFHFNPLRAVPENSPIFDLCRTGQVKAVELLIQKGHGSVLDTSPKGWTPLHVSQP